MTTQKILKIGTHSGSFHCDDAMACSMLKLLPAYKTAEIVRSRDYAVLDECDIVVDVGGVYDVAKNRFDHHQKTFTQVLADANIKLKGQEWAMRTKLSSAGLVYAHFGREILKVMADDPVTEEYLDILYKSVYENLIESVDAIDNGIDQYSGENIQQCYKVKTDLSTRVSRLNPSWLESSPDYQTKFYSAMKITLEEFESTVFGFNEFWQARDIVKNAIDQRHKIDSQGRAIFLDRFCPWKKHLYTFEDEEYINKEEILYTLYASDDGSVRIQCVGVSEGGFANRKSLPASWRGIRGDELATVSGVDDVVFCHVAGFIGGAKSKEGALKMLKMALDEVEAPPEKITKME